MRGHIAIVLAFAACTGGAFAQNDATRADTIKMSKLISERTGIQTVAAVVPRGDGLYDVNVQFNGLITNYKGVMGVVVGAVGETTIAAKYRTEWCYIVTRERGRERISTRDIRAVQSLVLSGNIDAGWNLFVSKTQRVQ